ncbi:MAG: hypothetical protein Q4A92_01915 [Corynebacterium sp.]|nr:hypothetical protein [Corynebacterium sp.]
MLFDDLVPELPEGAYYLPRWLTLEQQRWLVRQFHIWARGPVPRGVV